MSDSIFEGLLRPSRRSVVKSGMVLAAGLSPLGRAMAAGAPPPMYQRVSVTSAEGLAMLESYKIAIGKLLALPPTDPRNWYRNAFVHLLDCPHMNWWLFPWHRGYVGWFEQTCREMSGNPQFAFPFWDWTATPTIPLSFGEGTLNPSNPAFIDGFAKFKAAFTGPMNDFWSKLTAAQRAGLVSRGYTSMDQVWSAAESSFFPSGSARALAPGAPFDAPTMKAVSASTVKEGLKPQTFVPFSSSATANHQGHGKAASVGILESQPHNLVHNCIGGFMEEFFSPVDPVFFMHHSNIDRLWSVWTQKQIAIHAPTLPTGPDLAKWSQEPFTFFHGPTGAPVALTKAGDYAQVGNFNYIYGAGTGDEVVAAAKANGPRLLRATSFATTFKAAALGNPAALATVTLPAATQETIIAHITVAMPTGDMGQSLNVFLNLPAGVSPTTDRPEFVGALQFFGMHHGGEGGTVTFALPITESVRANGKPAGPQHLQVFPAKVAHPVSHGPMLEMSSPLKVTSIKVGTS